jgi:hypothetical protein
MLWGSKVWMLPLEGYFQDKCTNCFSNPMLSHVQSVLHHIRCNDEIWSEMRCHHWTHCKDIHIRWTTFSWKSTNKLSIYIYIYICIHGKMALQVQHGPGAPTCKHAYIDILLRFNRLNVTIKWCGTCPPKRCHRSAPLTRFNRGCRKVPHSDECAIAHHHPNTNKL